MQLKFLILAIMTLDRVLTIVIAIFALQDIMSDDITAAIQEKRDCLISFYDENNKRLCENCKPENDDYTICQITLISFFYDLNGL